VQRRTGPLNLAGPFVVLDVLDVLDVLCAFFMELREFGEILDALRAFNAEPTASTAGSLPAERGADKVSGTVFLGAAARAGGGVQIELVDRSVTPGLPRSTLRRTAISSASVRGSFTCSNQPG
jgi:hypothetical protein